ncbi:MAG: hypothetical protein ABIR83_12930 [Nakamurella sp.]
MRPARTVSLTAFDHPLDGRAGHRRTDRPWGIAVLLTVFVMALAGPAVMRPAVAGTAHPLPMAPPVGSCVDVHGAAVTLVASCVDLHTAEVVGSWDAGTQPTETGDAMTVDSCKTTRDTYLDVARTGPWNLWTRVTPAVSTIVLVAPDAGRDAYGGWTACAISAEDGVRVRGSLHLGFTGETRPDGHLASCYTTRTAAAENRRISCDKPHRIELLATLAPVAGSNPDGSTIAMPSPDVLHVSCAMMMQSMTKSADFSYGGAIKVVAETIPPEPNATTTVPPPRCFIETTAAAVVLTGSVIGLAHEPLPMG